LIFNNAPAIVTSAPVDMRRSAVKSAKKRTAARLGGKRTTRRRVRKAGPARPGHDAAKRLSPEERRAQILGVAQTLFADRNYDEIGMLDVANASGITQGLVYHYFESKDALFRAAMEASTAELLEACLPDPELPVPVQFEFGVKGYLDYVEGRRVAYLNIFHGPAAGSPVFQPIVERTRNAIVGHVIDRLGLTGRTIPVTRLSMRGYLGYIEYTILDWLEHRSVSRDALERLIFAIIITALRLGFEADQDVPLTPSQLADFELSYKRHFGLS
jgi:AcrR family transcriptional regulator